MIDIRTGKPMTRRSALTGLAGILAAGVAPAAVVRSMLGARGVATSGGGWKNPYVTDGLIAMFDGEWNAGGGIHSNSGLVEIVSGDVLNQTGCVDIGSNYILGGPDSLFIGSENKIGLYNALLGEVTIEIIYSPVLFGGGYLSYCTFINGLSRRYLFFYGSYYNGENYLDNGFQIRASSWNTSGAVSKNVIFPSSSYGKMFKTVGGVNATSVYRTHYQNGSIISNRTNTRGSLTGDFPATYTIFGCTGEIYCRWYCFRIYNRSLTSEELNHNSEVDVSRFGIV